MNVPDSSTNTNNAYSVTTSDSLNEPIRQDISSDSCSVIIGENCENVNETEDTPSRTPLSENKDGAEDSDMEENSKENKEAESLLKVLMNQLDDSNIITLKRKRGPPLKLAKLPSRVSAKTPTTRAGRWYQTKRIHPLITASTMKPAPLLKNIAKASNCETELLDEFGYTQVVVDSVQSIRAQLNCSNSQMIDFSRIMKSYGIKVESVEKWRVKDKILTAGLFEGKMISLTQDGHKEDQMVPCVWIRPERFVEEGTKRSITCRA